MYKQQCISEMLMLNFNPQGQRLGPHPGYCPLWTLSIRGSRDPSQFFCSLDSEYMWNSSYLLLTRNKHFISDCLVDFCALVGSNMFFIVLD